MMVRRVVLGDRVQVLCAPRLTDGRILDEYGGAPIWLNAGSPAGLPGVGDALIGMSVGENKMLVIPPARGFGLTRPDKIFRASLGSLPVGVAVGDRTVLAHGKASVSVVIRDIDERGAIVDANHPLAGQTLSIDLELLAIASRFGD